MRQAAGRALEIAHHGLRVAAALFLLGFMVGDLAFPQYFCEEYVVLHVDGLASVAATASPSPAPARASAVACHADEQIHAGSLGPTGLDGDDYCLHIVHRQHVAIAEPPSARLPYDTSPDPLAPNVDLNPPYHPPQSL